MREQSLLIICEKIKIPNQNYKQNFEDEKKWVVEVKGNRFKVSKIVYSGRLTKEEIK